jgi:transposase InsO family protein
MSTPGTTAPPGSVATMSRQPPALVGRRGNTIHHSNAGSQYTAMHFTETLMLNGLIPSVGTVGDALDKSLGFIVHLLAWVGWRLVF